MATKRWVLLVLAAAMISILAGCNSGSTFDVQNPPPPPQSNPSISFQSQPQSSIAVGLDMNVTAVVNNDPNNYGVDWALGCPSAAQGNCGTLSLTHTASGSATTYTAPSTITLGALSGVNIVAYATANHAVNTSASITVGSFDSGLKAGNYVLQAQGSGGQFAGVVTLDGQGNITAGEQTLDFFGESVTDQGLTGSYFIGNDGRGTITINDPNSGIGTEIFALVFLNDSSSQSLLSVVAGPLASATGTMVPQTNSAAPSGSYAFVSTGTALLFANAAPGPIAFGGILNISSPTNVTGLADEVFGRTLNANGANGVTITGSYAAVPNDPFGTVILYITAPFGPPNSSKTNVSLQFTAYIVDATHIQLIESDQAAGTGFGSTAGLAIGQGNAAGNFSNASLPAGTSFVYTVNGQDLSTNAINNGELPYTLASAGLFQTDGNGNLSAGFTDISLLYTLAQGTNANPQIGAQISAQMTGGTFSVGSNGRATLTDLVFNPVPRHGYSPTLLFYLTGLTGEGQPAGLILAAGDTTAGSIFYPSIGTGIVYQQSTATAKFSGGYGFSFTQQNGAENDGTAQFNVNTADTPPVSGLADASNAGQDNSFLGTSNSPTSNTPFSGTLYANPTPQGSASNAVFTFPITVDYYYIDPDHGLWVETDLISEFSGQTSFGYYAARTPLCDGCP